MRSVWGVGVGTVLALLTTACSVPPLWHVTNNGPFEKDISIDDVVERVKCELADAVRQKMDETKLKWLESWTAKADLTLQVNETGSITPNVAYVQPLHNAYDLGTGPSSVAFPSGAPGTTAGAISQNFTLGVGATFSGQVFRTETVSFSLSLSELKAWREKGAGKGLPCSPAGNSDLQGNLDLKSWTDAALTPVEMGDLGLGIHPAPGSVVKASGPGGEAPEIQPEDEGWISYYQAAAKTAADGAAKSAQEAWGTLRQAQRSRILSPKVKNQIAKLANAAAEAAAYAGQANANANPKDASGKALPVDKKTAQLNAVEADKNAEAAALDDAAEKLAVNPNAPIDSLSHSLNFIVTVGASLSPSWTLLHWKGPANVGNLAGYSGIRTHTLAIALGSPAAGGNPEANRVLNNDAFRQAIQAPF